MSSLMNSKWADKSAYVPAVPPAKGAEPVKPKKQLPKSAPEIMVPDIEVRASTTPTTMPVIRGPQDLKMPLVEDLPIYNWFDHFHGPSFVHRLQSESDDEMLFESLEQAPEDLLRQGAMVKEVPLLFYIVASSEIRLLRLALRKGCDVNCVASAGGVQVPLLVFSIMHGHLANIDMREVISVLLGAGAKVSDQIPSRYLQSAIEDLESSYSIKDIGTRPNAAWCRVPEYLKVFESGLSMYIRQCLGKALRMKVRPRDVQIAMLRNAEALMELPYSLIGQQLAVTRMHNTLMGRMLNSGNKPLVLVLAGPSGHGKTELASRLASLLNIDICKVDCASLSEPEDFFGILGMYNNAGGGTPLNNYLASKNEKDGLVILDEFEKTSKTVHDAFLNILTGEYEDRRTSTKVDSKRIIWILTTNAFDSLITRYYKDNQGIFNDESTTFEAQHDCYATLIRELRKTCMTRFSDPIAGRVTDFIPFLPFNKEDQIVGVEKLLTDFTEEARIPVRLRQPFRLFGDVELSIINPAKLCKFIAEDAYMPELGMRSLKNAMTVKLESAVMAEFREIPEAIKESGPPTKITLRVAGVKVDAAVTEYNGKPYTRS